MKGLVLVSFADVVHGTKVAGATIDVPPGTDWVRAGLVRLEPETAMGGGGRETAVLPTPSRPVTDVNGLGPGAAKKLAQLNIRTIADLAGADPVVISGLPKIGLSTAEAWVAEAATLQAGE